MSAALYNRDILRLAASLTDARLAAPHGTVERRSPVCGSRVIVDVRLGPDGRIEELGQQVRACALGQAAAALMAAHAVDRTGEELAEARDALTAFLAGDRENPGNWPGLDLFVPARPYTSRHASIRLAFEAVAEAAALAAAAHEDAAALAAAARAEAA